jgi:glycerol-3-phosphate responsive antiterminator
MIKGTDVARAAGAPDHADMIEAMLQQLLIVLVKRNGGSVNVHVDEIDGTDSDLLGMQLLPDQKTFHFSVSTKS